jgi:hypothetical protein
MIRDKYKSLFKTAESANHRRAVGVFSAQVTKLAALNDEARVVRFVKEAFSKEEPIVVERLAKIAEAFVKCGSAEEKLAFSPLLAGLQQTLALQPLEELKRQREEEAHRMEAIKSSLSQLVKSNPALAADPQGLAQHFEVMTRFAPDVAAEPTLAGNILGQLHKMGPGAMTHQMVAELQKMQQIQDASRHERHKQVVESVAPFTRIQG